MRLAGTAVLYMLDAIVRCFVQGIDSFGEATASSRVNLEIIKRHAITLATSEAVYGLLNPYRDSGVEDSFNYTFSNLQFVYFSTLGLLLLIDRYGVGGRLHDASPRCPSNTPSAEWFAGRKRVVAAFKCCFADIGFDSQDLSL